MTAGGGTAATAETDEAPVPAQAPAQRPRGRLGTFVQRAVGACTVLVVLGVTLAPRMSMNDYDALAAAAGLVLVVTGWVALGAFAPRPPRLSDRQWDAVAAAACALTTTVAAVAAYAGAYRTGWDASTIKFTVTQPPDARVPNYFSAYPNNRPFLAVARTVAGWGRAVGLDYDGSLAVLNTVSFLLAAVAVYVTVRLVAGAARGVLALLLLGVLLATSPWMSVGYTDMAALCLPIGAVALLTVALRRSLPAAALLAAAAGAVLAVGFLIKTTPVVGLVALLVALAVAATARDGSGRRLLVIGAAAVAAFLVTIPVAWVWVASAEDLPPLQEGRGATPLTYVAAGVRTQTWTDGSTAYGAWDRAVVREVRGRDQATQDAVALRFIREEFDRRGLLGMAGFAVDKTLFNWGDGTFWARDEGADATNPALRSGPVVDVVLAWNAPAGSLFGLHVLLAQVSWLAVLLAMGVGLLRSRSRPELLLTALTVVGIAVFVLVFQGRSRYLIGHVPVVVALAAAVVPVAKLRR